MSLEQRSSGRKRKKTIKAEEDEDDSQERSVSPHHGWAPPPHTSNLKLSASSSAPTMSQLPSLPSFIANRGAGGGSGSLSYGSGPSTNILPPLPNPPTLKKKGRTSAASRAASSSNVNGGVSVPVLLAPDYTLNPAGPASSSTTSFRCPQDGCGKVYKGKHARSIWRRHLQDKHGIPLSAQPRRTRWDNDANRPKSEEERRARTLDSKRRWARKNRAERGGTAGTGRSGDGDGDFDDDDFEEGDWDDEESESANGHHYDYPPPQRSNGVAIGPPSYPKNDEYEEEDDLQTSSYPPPSAADRYPLVHRDNNSSSSLSSHPLDSHLAPAPYHGQPHVRQANFYPLPLPGSYLSPGPSSRISDASFYSTAPAASTSLSTVAGRAALVPSPSFGREPYSVPDHPETAEKAALLLAALKRPSSPPSPAVPEHDHGDTSVDSVDASFGFSARSNTNTSEGDNNATPPSESEDQKPREEDIAALQSRALKRVPILTTAVESNVRDSESLVRTPRTSSARITMESSPAFKRNQDARRDNDDDDDDENDDEDDDEDDRRYRRGGRSSSRASSSGLVRKKTRPTSSHDARSSSKSRAGVTSEVEGFVLTSPDAPSSRDRARRRPYSTMQNPNDNMLPPHSASSSSSTSSFNLSTPAGPSRDSYRQFFPSSASNGDFYAPSSSYQQQAHTSSSRAPRGLSSPPMGFPSSSSYTMLSSPAHPGVSKQLGLTAQPGPGVFSAASQTPGRGGIESDERGGWNGKPLPGIKAFDSLGRK